MDANERLVAVAAQDALLLHNEQRREVQECEQEVDKDEDATAKAELEDGSDGRQAVDKEGDGGGRVRVQKRDSRLPHRPLQPQRKVICANTSAEHPALLPSFVKHEDVICGYAYHDPKTRGGECGERVLAEWEAHEPVHEREGEDDLKGGEEGEAPLTEVVPHIEANDHDSKDEQVEVIREGDE